ncbi:MAG: ornithine cyclodeaminase family protein [Dehalococcoidia bacterium]|nr:ornithine cyclodeaminase family protein [Dehalococcoidia bacterium]
MPTLLLSKNDIKGLLSMPAVIEAVEQAIREHAAGHARMPHKVYLDTESGDFRAMPALLLGAAGVKWVCAYPGNPAKGLPNVMATLIYSDPGTGYPLAIMDAMDITAYRTGATAAIASKYLARRDSATLGLIGAGQQAYTQLMAHAELFRLKKIKVFDILPAAAERLARAFPQHQVEFCSLQEAAQADIVCTLTTARKPFLKRQWILAGTHINAVGADAPGKQELEPEILKEATVVVDDIKQAVAGGEVNVPITQGVFKVEQIHATLGEIITGQKPGRKDRNSITVFDSTGLAIEDIAVARIVYEKAIAAGGYQSINFMDESASGAPAKNLGSIP